MLWFSSRGSVLAKIELVTFRIGGTVLKDHVGILAETIYAGNDQQRILGVAVHIPQLHGAEVVHGYHAGGNAAEDVLLVHHGIGQVMAEQLVPKAERLCVADADGRGQPQLRFRVEGLLMGFGAFVPEIVVEHTHISTGAGAGNLTFIDPALIAGESDLVTVPILQQKAVAGDGPDNAGVEVELISQKLHDFVLADGPGLIQNGSVLSFVVSLYKKEVQRLFSAMHDEIFVSFEIQAGMCYHQADDKN